MDGHARTERSDHGSRAPVAGPRWVATECRELATELVGAARFEPDHRLERPPTQSVPCSRGDALVVAARGHLGMLGRSPSRSCRRRSALERGRARSAVARWKRRLRPSLPCRRGAHLRGCSADGSALDTCSRAFTLRCATAHDACGGGECQQFMRFLLSWRTSALGTPARSGGVVEVIEQLQDTRRL